MPKSGLINTLSPRINPPARYHDPEVVRKATNEARQCPTIRIKTAGILLGVGETLAYKMAADGTLPTIQVGKRHRVISARLLETLGISGQVTA